MNFQNIFFWPQISILKTFSFATIQKFIISLKKEKKKKKGLHFIILGHCQEGGCQKRVTMRSTEPPFLFNFEDKYPPNVGIRTRVRRVLYISSQKSTVTKYFNKNISTRKELNLCLYPHSSLQYISQNSKYSKRTFGTSGPICDSGTCHRQDAKNLLEQFEKTYVVIRWAGPPTSLPHRNHCS